MRTSGSGPDFVDDRNDRGFGDSGTPSRRIRFPWAGRWAGDVDDVVDRPRMRCSRRRESVAVKEK